MCFPCKMDIAVLRIEIDELKNSIQHLERSNRELKQLLQTEPDSEYRVAVGENIMTLAKKRARVSALEEQLQHLTGKEYESDFVTVPVFEPATDGFNAESNPTSALTAAGASGMHTEELQAQPQEASSSGMDIDEGPVVNTAVGSSGEAVLDPNGTFAPDCRADNAWPPAAVLTPNAGLTAVVAQSGASTPVAGAGAGVWL